MNRRYYLMSDGNNRLQLSETIEPRPPLHIGEIVYYQPTETDQERLATSLPDGVILTRTQAWPMIVTRVIGTDVSGHIFTPSPLIVYKENVSMAEYEREPEW